MRFQLLPLVFVSALGATSMAFAATTTTGTIQAFDMKAHTLTLEDGNVYMLPGAFNDPGLKAGEKVSVLWDKTGNAGATKVMRDAISVTVLK